MAPSVTVFRGPRQFTDEIRFQSEDRPDSVSACIYRDGELRESLPLTDSACDALLDWLIDRRAARLRNPEGGSR